MKLIAKCFPESYSILNWIEPGAVRFQCKIIALTVYSYADISVSYIVYMKVQPAIFAANKCTITGKENVIKLNVICLLESYLICIESSSEQCNFNAKFLYLLSISRLTFFSRMSCIQSLARDLCIREICYNKERKWYRTQCYLFPWKLVKIWCNIWLFWLMDFLWWRFWRILMHFFESMVWIDQL